MATAIICLALIMAGVLAIRSYRKRLTTGCCGGSGEAAVKKMEADYAKLEEVHGENVEVGCESEKAAQGQSEINTFAARMKDYRNKIAERQAKEGKAYLSFYHIDAESYEIVKSEKK